MNKSHFYRFTYVRQNFFFINSREVLVKKALALYPVEREREWVNMNTFGHRISPPPFFSRIWPFLGIENEPNAKIET